MSVPAEMSSELRWRPQVRIESDDTDLVIHAEGRTTTLRGLPLTLHAWLRDPASAPPAGSSAEESARAQLLRRLGHLMMTSIRVDDEELMSVQQTTRDASYRPAPVAPDSTVRLSRFALMRSLDGVLVLESPLSQHRFGLTSVTARSIASRLGSPAMMSDLASPHAAEVVCHLLGAGMVEAAGSTGAFLSDADERLRLWDFHDLVMHGRSRSGRWDEPLGALSPYRDSVTPLSAMVESLAAGSVVVPLPAPRLELPDALTTVLAERRSIRDYAERPLDAETLSTFLFHTFRVRARFDPPAGEESKISRPYPSGGGLYEHELYLVVRRCEGITAGIYRYDGARHALVLRNDSPDDAQAMLNVAAAATGHSARPDVLLTLTARFQRMSWRYRSIAYANILRTTGAIYQTMYLVATALDVAPCGLGNGDADLSARVLDLDYLSESSVGDFILGRRSPDDTVEGDTAPGWTLLPPPVSSI